MIVTVNDLTTHQDTTSKPWWLKISNGRQGEPILVQNLFNVAILNVLWVIVASHRWDFEIIKYHCRSMQIIFGQVRLVRSPGPTPCSTHNRVHSGLSRFLQRKHSQLNKKLEFRDISKKIDLLQPGGKLEDPFCTSVDKAHCSWVDRVEQTETGEKCEKKLNLLDFC